MDDLEKRISKAEWMPINMATATIPAHLRALAKRRAAGRVKHFPDDLRERLRRTEQRPINMPYAGIVAVLGQDRTCRPAFLNTPR